MKRLLGSACITIAVLGGSLSLAADPWQSVTAQNQPLLPGNGIQLLKHGATEGQLWVGTASGAVTIEKGVIHPVKQAKGLCVWDVTARPGGGFWIGHGKGVRLVDGDRAVDALNDLTVGTIQAVGTQFWALAKNESRGRNVIMRADGETWVEVPELKNFAALDLIRDSRGIFWLVLDGNGALEIDPAKGGRDFKHHLQRMNIASILTDSKGNTWCGLMDGGIAVRRSGEWKRELESERSQISWLAEDAGGNLWAASCGNGVWMFDGKAWKAFLQDQGPINLLKVTSDKRVWVSTQKSGGLRYWDGAEWKVSLEGPLPVICLVELPNVALVAGGVLDGLHILGNYSVKGE